MGCSKPPKAHNIGALIIRTGFWSPLYYNHSKEPSKNSIVSYLGPHRLLKFNEFTKLFFVPDRF